MKKLLILAFFLALFIPNRADAQGLNLSIYPPIIEIQTTPPASPSTPITLTNNSQEEVTLQIELIPFKQIGNDGQIQLIPKMSNNGFYPYIQNKIQFIVEGKKVSTINLQPLESKQIELNINLAKGDPSGDYYYSIIFINSGETLNSTSTSSLPAGIATNLLLSIGPKKPIYGGIKIFSTQFFKNSGPVDFKLQVHNGSENLIQPSGNIAITNIFGQKSGEVEILPQYILSNSDRYLQDSQASNSSKLNANFDKIPTVKWNEKFLLGLYKATANITLGQNAKPLTQSIYFIAFPTYLFFIIFVLLFVTLSVYLKVKKRI